MANKQEQVNKILQMPIHCEKECTEIRIEDGVILSGQKYKNGEDEDMSDFAVGFYEIIYDGILKGKLLDENGCLTSEEFAGDTMNSFSSIANVTPNAGHSKATRTAYGEWPIYLQDYYRSYHCLANFWLLPMTIGRKSMKFSRFDSLDVCLAELERDYAGKMSIYGEYYRNICDFETFCKVHYVGKGRDKNIILNLYKDEEGCAGSKLVKQATQDIIMRASKISVSKYSDKLWDYFDHYKLFAGI